MIKLTKEEIAIFGRPNFACANIANRLKELGLYDCAEKAEDEQAIAIHFMAELYKKYGCNWRAQADKILKKETP